MQFMNLGAIAPEPADGVAYAAHVGGFIFGAVAARLLEGRQWHWFRVVSHLSNPPLPQNALPGEVS
jgi:membrane associated rhomboid family serine protease